MRLRTFTYLFCIVPVAFTGCGPQENPVPDENLEQVIIEQMQPVGSILTEENLAESEAVALYAQEKEIEDIRQLLNELEQQS